MQLQHQGNSEMVLLSIFFTESESGDHQRSILYSFCRSMRLLFSDINITSNLSVAVQTGSPYIHLSVVFPSEIYGPHCYTTILLSENIPNI